MEKYIFISREMGSLIKKARKAKGWVQEDLVREGLSTGTISNIERGGCRVSSERWKKILQLLALDEQIIQSKLAADSLDQSDIRLQLEAIEYHISMIRSDDKWHQLCSLERANESNENETYSAWIYYLKGNHYEIKQKWEYAESNYLQTIHQVELNPQIQQSNLHTASYNGLSNIYYNQNRLEKALEFVERGLKAFISTGERKHIEFNLLTNKVIFLEKLNHNEKALQVLNDQLWNRFEEITSSEVCLNMYQMKALLLNKLGFPDQAIPYAVEGIRQSRINEKSDRGFELWTTLGESYILQNKIQNAEECFQTALALEKQVRKKYLTVSTLTRLGLLYLKQNRLPEAKQKLQQAINSGAKTGNVFGQLEALTAYSDLCRQQVQPRQAIKHLEQALKIAKKHASYEQICDILWNLAELSKQINSPLYQKYTEEFVFMYRKIRQEGGDMLMKSTSYLGDPPPK